MRADGVSMLPSFPEHAFVECASTPYDQLKVGDSVIAWDYTHKTGAIFYHHRIIQKQGDSFITRGDNELTNPKADAPWMTRDNYICRTTGLHSQMLFLSSAPTAP